MKVTAFCNQKGGVGKTLLTACTAYRLARTGRVLAIDMDPQGNLTDVLGVAGEPGMLTINDVLADVAGGGRGGLEQAMVPAADPWGQGCASTGGGVLVVVPADRLLAGRESDTSVGRETRLAAALDGLTGFDHVLLDCPPALSMLTINALVAADQALIVTEPRRSSVEAVGEMIATISQVRLHYNPDLVLAGIIVNKWLAGRVDRQQWMDDLATTYSDFMLAPPVPEREALANIATSHAPLTIEATDVAAALDAITATFEGGVR